MSTQAVFACPANIYRVFPATDVEVVKRDEHGDPIAVCATAHTNGDLAVALVLLKESPVSFVLSDGMRYWPDGTVQPCDPSLPASIAELRQVFDVEIVTFEWPGPRPRVYLFTSSQQEWEQAKSAVRHLLEQKLLSPRSYIEGTLNGEVQGLSAQNLDARPDSAGLVAMVREAAYCIQNSLYEKEDDDEYDEDDEDGNERWTMKYDEDDEDDDDTWEQDFFEEEEAAACDEEDTDPSWLDEEEKTIASRQSHTTPVREIIVALVERLRVSTRRVLFLS